MLACELVFYSLWVSLCVASAMASPSHETNPVSDSAGIDVAMDAAEIMECMVCRETIDEGDTIWQCARCTAKLHKCCVCDDSGRITKISSCPQVPDIDVGFAGQCTQDTYLC